MTPHVNVTEDWHTHTTQSDGSGSLSETVAAAKDKQLTRLSITDHVRASTTWVPEYVTAVNAAAATEDIWIRCGVETKILNSRGLLDVPEDVWALGGERLQINVADHQYPSPDGPLKPEDVKQALSAGLLTTEQVIQNLVVATASAVSRVDNAVIVHLFSLLPKMGLDETAVHEHHLSLLADACQATGARVEVNEKWQTPSSRTLIALAARGVLLVAGSDAHSPGDVGRYDYVNQFSHRAVPNANIAREPVVT